VFPARKLASFRRGQEYQHFSFRRSLLYARPSWLELRGRNGRGISLRPTLSRIRGFEVESPKWDLNQQFSVRVGKIGFQSGAVRAPKVLGSQSI